LIAQFSDFKMIDRKGGRVLMLTLPDGLQSILDAEYPRFSAEEMARRRAAIEDLLEASGADHLVYCGANRVGSVVQWLTQWPVTAEAVGVLSPGKRDDLFVQYFNHLPQARRLAEADVTWGGESSIRAAADALGRRKARKDRVASIGPLSAEQHAVLAERFGKIKSLNKDYVALRQIKSEQELDWLRIGAAFSDLGMQALRDGLKAGLNERELADLIERAYVAHGGVNVIHYLGVTGMNAPRLAVPAQFPSTRKVQKGDVVFAEISASFWDHPGQVLRTFALGVEPAPLYKELHAAADAAFDAIAAVLRDGAMPADVIAASGVIEEAGFTTIDDLVHGYGGGYLPPILGCKSRPGGPVPEAPFRAGQTVVIQPNVVTLDHTAGVQTGEMVLITETGIERMHALPRGFVQL
jgi:Xaa-Pro aminopeptidase